MNLSEKFWSGARLLLATGIVLRLGGIAVSSSPSLWQLVVGLIILLIVGRGVGESREDHGVRRWQEWTGVLRENTFGVTLFLLAIVGTAIRMLSIGFDLGEIPLNIDERRLAESVLEFFRTGEVPHDTVEHYPGILFWILAGSSLLAYLWALLTDVARGLQGIQLETFVLVGRITSVILAAGITIFTGLIGRALHGPITGLLAAAVVAVVPLSVDISSFLRNEAAQLLFIIAAVWAAIELAQTRGRGFALAAGGFAGVATAVKYSSVFVLLAVMVAAAIPVRARVSRTLISLLGFVLALTTTNHFLWADFPNFVRQLAVEVAMTGPGHWSATDNPARFYLTILGDLGPGVPLLVMSAGFVVYACAYGKVIHWTVLVFPLTYMWFMTQQPAQFQRWVYPLVPFVAVAGASGLSASIDWLQSCSSGQPRSRRIAFQVAFAVLAAGVLWAPVRMGATVISRRAAPATYDEVRHWLREHTVPDDRVLAEEYWLDLSDLNLKVHRVPKLSDNLAGSPYSLWAHDWILVPEPDVDHPGLQHLQLAQTFLAGHEFGGSRGFDFMVYAAPYRALGRGYRDPVKVNFGEPTATSFLGPKWIRDDSRLPGLLIPTGGASVFVPPAERADIAIHITFMSNGSGVETPTVPFSVEMDGEGVPLVEGLSNTHDVRMVSGNISLIPTGVMEMRLASVEELPVRIIELTLD